MLAVACLIALGLNSALNWRVARKQKLQLWGWAALVCLGYVALQWVKPREIWAFGPETVSQGGGYLFPIACMIVIWSQFYSEFPPKDAFSACERQPLLSEAKPQACSLCHSSLSNLPCQCLPCGHTYHSQCLHTWQRHSTVCLLCYRARSSLLSKAE